MPEEGQTLEVPKRTLEEITPGLIQMLQSVFTAARNVQMYPPESPAAVKLVEAAFVALDAMIPAEGCLDLSFIEDKMVINSEHIDEGFQKRGIIRNFHELMRAKKISSITFWSGMTPEELRKFLVLFSSKSRLNDEGDKLDFSAQVEGEGIEHIEIDEQMYVAISKREKVVDVRAVTEQDSDPAMRALKDEVFARFLAGEALPGDASGEAVREMLSNPDQMVAVVQAFVEAHGWSGDMRALPLGIDETRGILERIAVLLAGVDDPNLRNKLSREVERIARQIEVPELKEILLTPGGAQGQAFLPRALLPVLGDEKFSALLDQVVDEYAMLEKAGDEGDWPSERVDSARTVIEQASRTRPDWANRIAELSAGEGLASGWNQRESDEIYSAELARTLMSGADLSMCDMAKGPVLVNAAGYLADESADDLARSVIGKVRERFRREPLASRTVAARQILKLASRLNAKGKTGLMGGLDAEVAEVINAHIDAHGTMVDFAAATARAGAGGHLDGMYVPNLAIDRLMNSDTGKVVKAVFTSDDEAAREAVTKALLEMPDKAIPAMLDTVQEATDGPTVESVAASLKEFKDPTPWIASRLGKEMEPWQLANLVRLFAMVAAPESARALEPVLASPEVEPHLEALKALGALGGKAALSMLLDESMSPDPQMQVPALRGLGRFHDYSAVRRLTLLITPGRKGEIFESDQALIAACRSLGELKAVPAVGLVADLALGRKHIRVSDEVRAAAALALGKIGGAEANDSLKKLGKDSSMLVRSTARKALGQA
jgi:hypothetical protein